MYNDILQNKTNSKYLESWVYKMLMFRGFLLQLQFLEMIENFHTLTIFITLTGNLTVTVPSVSLNDNNWHKVVVSRQRKNVQVTVNDLFSGRYD